MSNAEANTTENTATVAEHGAAVAPEKASQKKGAPKGQKAAKAARPKKEAKAGKKAAKPGPAKKVGGRRV